MSDAELPRVPTPLPVKNTRQNTRVMALGVALLLSFFAVARLVAPLWVGIAFGTVMAFTAQPLFRVVTRKLGERRTVAAVLTTVATGIVWTVTCAISIYVLSTELMSIVAELQKHLAADSTHDFFGARGSQLLKQLGVNRTHLMHLIQDEVGRASTGLTAAAALVLQTSFSALLGLIIALMTMYYVLLEWPKLPVRLERVLPLDPRHTRALVLEFRSVGVSAMVGSIVTALVQGGLAGMSFAIGGVHHAISWGLVTAVASFVPAVGTTLVWIPVGIYLLVEGHIFGGVFVLAWGLIVVVAISDYVIRPRLVGKEGHPLLTLLALLGGLEVFGLGGLIMGPILMALFVAILRIYERESMKRAEEEARECNDNVPEKR